MALKTTSFALPFSLAAGLMAADALAQPHSRVYDGMRPAITGHVVNVVDGDTFDILPVASLRSVLPQTAYYKGRDFVRVRLWGIDTAERGNNPGFAIDKAFLEAVALAQIVSCYDKGRSFERMVGDCFLPDQRAISGLMINRGYAQELCNFSGGAFRACAPEQMP